MKHIENTLKEAGSEILKGNADIAPYKLKDETACKYCPYIAICRFDKYISGYNYREINQLNDEEIIEKLKTERRNSMPWSAQQQQAINTYDKNYPRSRSCWLRENFCISRACNSTHCK